MKPKISIFLARRLFTNTNGKELYTYANGYKGTFALCHENTYSKKKKKHYQVLDIQTEKQLVRFIYDNFCYGSKVRCFVAGHYMGHSVPGVFWRGEIGSEGFEFFKDEINKKEVQELEEIYNVDEADDLEEKAFLEEMIEKGKEDLRKDKSNRKYGFTPHLRSSGRRGEQHLWEEEDEGLIKREFNKKVSNKKFDEMSIDDLNNF